VLIDKTLRRTTASSATSPGTKPRSQNGRAPTIAGLDVLARASANKEAHEMTRWLTPAALICDLPIRYRYVGRRKRLLCAGHSQFPLWREKPEHGSNQQERGHVANQVTYLMSIISGLRCHDAGVHDARPDRE
jgi:hypothetical protein